MYSQSEINKAKSVSILQILAEKGHQPVREHCGELQYFSPFRNERTPSMFVNVAANVFNDFAHDKGDSIRLYQTLHNVGFVEAVKRLLSFSGEFSVSIQPSAANPQKSHVLKRIDKLQNRSLIQYLQNRCIDVKVASRFVSEIHYITSRGNFYGIGFNNNSGGWEIRNPGFKGCLGRKDISTRGTGKQDLYLFEGFIDFLSLMSVTKGFKKKGAASFIILNSLSLINRVPYEKFTNVFSFLDNDESGRKAYKSLYEQYPGKVVDSSQMIFPEHKDYNELLISLSHDEAPENRSRFV